jgi:Fe2+ or Zn2+ uptake regulation protein
LDSATKYRMTHQRKVILEVLRELESHPTADELYMKVREKIPRISLGTVYRNLDILATCGLIQRLEPGRTQMRFDGSVKEHCHLTCARCGRIEDVLVDPSDNPLVNLDNVMGHLTKYGIFGHRLEFFGLCSKCLSEGYAVLEDMDFDYNGKGGER